MKYFAQLKTKEDDLELHPQTLISDSTGTTIRRQSNPNTMKITSPLRPSEPKPNPATPSPKISSSSDESVRLMNLEGVARRLGVSERYVQTLVQRKVIPVIRLGRRCTRFDLDSVMNAVKKFEIHEVR